MGEKLEYKIKELKVDNDPLMKFIIKFDAFNLTAIVEGYYKIKLDGATKFHMLAKKERPFLSGESITFDETLQIMFLEIKEKVYFIEALTNLFNDIDHIEIPNI